MTLDEFRLAASNDFAFYAENCLQIKHKATATIQPFKVNDAQRIVLADRDVQMKERGYVRQIILKGRQQGVSTLIGGIGYRKVTCNKGVSAFILTHLSDATDTIFEMVKRFQDYCPPQMVPTLTGDSGRKLTFGNKDSGYRVGTAGSKAVGRSSNIQFFHGSEVAFWPHAADHAAGVMNAMLSEGVDTENYLESTANGMGNYFHTQWQAAVSGQSLFKPIFIPWFLQAEYMTSTLPEEWERSAEEETLVSSFGLRDSQLAWRRNKIVELSGNGIDGTRLFMQEYPCYASEAFQMTGETGLILPEDVLKARKILSVSSIGPRIMGIDPSLGGDRFAIALRQGRVLEDLRYKRGDDVKTFGQRVTFCLNSINELQPDVVFIDMGYGADLVDRLRELTRVDIRCIAFGGSAIKDEYYTNKRAEMYGEFNNWLTKDNEQVQIIDSDELQADLCATLYTTDSNGRLQLLPKAVIKTKLGFSPDLSDAVVLTFAEPVVNFSGGRKTSRPKIHGNT